MGPYAILFPCSPGEIGGGSGCRISKLASEASIGLPSTKDQAPFWDTSPLAGRALAAGHSRRVAGPSLRSWS
jgi:hypothetical protein